MSCKTFDELFLELITDVSNQFNNRGPEEPEDEDYDSNC